jgi:TorA maturation chaperone TorD
MRAEWLGSLYIGLARALAADVAWPDWLCAAGSDWPLWLPAKRLAADNKLPRLAAAVAVLAEVPKASAATRKSAFNAVFARAGSAPIFLYESQFLGGRLLGEETRAVGKLYDSLGLELKGAELPDHASVELEFLAYLAEKEATDPHNEATWRAAQALFIGQHAGRWLPDLGRKLGSSTDPAWSAIGLLLTAVLTPERRGLRIRENQFRFPIIADLDSCSLCGFCVQTCPTGALKIYEDAQTTQLWLLPGLCVNCQKCERVCDENALTLNGHSLDLSPVLLSHSKRAACPGCGTATVSEAELSAVARRLGGRPAWLELCLECRALSFC